MVKKYTYKSDRRTDAASSIILPLDFTPGIYEVIIGRGRRCTEHYGNLRFKSIVVLELEAYSAAECKRQKSAIIARVLGLIKQNSSAGFVKKDVETGRWLSLNQAASRVTIAQAFRDACQDSYRSSRKSKQVKRKIQKEAQEGKKPEVKKEKKANPPKEEPLPPLNGQDDFDLDLEIGENFFEETEPIPVIATEKESTVVSEDSFANLFEAFAENVDLSDNPYEPIPIVSSEPKLPFSQPIRTLPEQKMEHQLGRFGRPAPSRTVRAAMSA